MGFFEFLNFWVLIEKHMQFFYLRALYHKNQLLYTKLDAFYEFLILISKTNIIAQKFIQEPKIDIFELFSKFVNSSNTDII